MATQNPSRESGTVEVPHDLREILRNYAAANALARCHDAHAEIGYEVHDPASFDQFNAHRRTIEEAFTLVDELNDDLMCEEMPAEAMRKLATHAAQQELYDVSSAMDECRPTAEVAEIAARARDLEAFAATCGPEPS